MTIHKWAEWLNSKFSEQILMRKKMMFEQDSFTVLIVSGVIIFKDNLSKDLLQKELITVSTAFPKPLNSLNLLYPLLP